jgi:hypothetical protein
MVASETGRTDALDRKASTVATFASLVTTLTATLGPRFIEQFGTSWALTLFITGLGALAFSVVMAVVALFPREYLSLGIAHLQRFPTWSEIRKPVAQVRGETMRGLVEAVSREREVNARKAGWVRWSFVRLLSGLVLIAAEAATLAIRMVSG